MVNYTCQLRPTYHSPRATPYSSRERRIILESTFVACVGRKYAPNAAFATTNLVDILHVLSNRSGRPHATALCTTFLALQFTEVLQVKVVCWRMSVILFNTPVDVPPVSVTYVVVSCAVK